MNKDERKKKKQKIGQLGLFSPIMELVDWKGLERFEGTSSIAQ